MRTAHRMLLFLHICSITYAPHFSSVRSWCCQEEASGRRKKTHHTQALKTPHGYQSLDLRQISPSGSGSACENYNDNIDNHPRIPSAKRPPTKHRPSLYAIQQQNAAENPLSELKRKHNARECCANQNDRHHSRTTTRTMTAEQSS